MHNAQFDSAYLHFVTLMKQILPGPDLAGTLTFARKTPGSRLNYMAHLP
jgi:hypothetical protein